MSVKLEVHTFCCSAAGNFAILSSSARFFAAALAASSSAILSATRSFSSLSSQSFLVALSFLIVSGCTVAKRAGWIGDKFDKFEVEDVFKTARTSTSSKAALTRGRVEDDSEVGGSESVKMRCLVRVRRDGTGFLSSYVSGRSTG